MADWIKVVTEIGTTRIRLKSICAYQTNEDASKLLIYTKDNSLFQISEDVEDKFKLLDSEFKIK